MIDSSRLEILVAEALERTAFVLVEPADESDSLAQTTRYAIISYHGEDNGEVHLAASEGFALELASSMLGEEPEDLNCDIEGEQAIAELANIIAGSIVLELGGDKRPISLGLPHLTQACPIGGDMVFCTLACMDQPLRVTWVPRNNIAAAA